MLLSEYLKKSEEFTGKQLKEILDFKLVSGRINKGAIGAAFEVQVFNKELDNKSEADLDFFIDEYHNELLDYYNTEVKIELKVSAAKVIKGKDDQLEYRAKERLVLSMINYLEEHPSNFKASHVYKKIKLMLIIYYLYEPNVDIPDYRLLTTFFNNLDNHDLSILERDYNIIINKIRNGEAHLLSGSDTFYLEACTKAANSNVTRKQAHSDIPAKPRAFALKNAYMNTLLNNSLSGAFTPIHNEENDIVYIEQKLTPFIGMTFEQMQSASISDYNKKSKNNKSIVIREILGIKSNSFNELSIFKNANIKFKSFNISSTGNPSDGVNFVNSIDFDKICDTQWENSDLYDAVNTMYFYCVFKKDSKTKVLTFLGYKFLGFTDEEIELARLDWENIKSIATTSKNILDDLPKMSDGGLFYPRTKGTTKEKSTRVLNNGQAVPGHAWWVNNAWIKEKVSKSLL